MGNKRYYIIAILTVASMAIAYFVYAYFNINGITQRTKLNPVVISKNESFSTPTVTVNGEAVINSFTVTQNQDEKNLPVVLATVAWDVTGADGTSLVVQCYQDAKVLILGERSKTDLCNKKTTLFNDKRNGWQQLIVMDTNIAKDTFRGPPVVYVSLEVNNFNPARTVKSEEKKIYVGEKLTTRLNAYSGVSGTVGAANTLRDYFHLMNSGLFDQALQYIATSSDIFTDSSFMYSSDYQYKGIIDYFPRAYCNAGFQHYCDVEISKIISSKEIDGGAFEVVAEFVDRGGKKVGVYSPCYSENSAECRPPQTQFSYILKKVGDGVFNIFNPIGP